MHEYQSMLMAEVETIETLTSHLFLFFNFVSLLVFLHIIKTDIELLKLDDKQLQRKPLHKYSTNFM